MVASHVGVATTSDPWGTLVGATGSPHDYTQAEPTGTQVGDLMVAFLGWAQNGGQTWSIVEGGWTSIPNFISQGVIPSGTSVVMKWAYRVKQLGDPSSWTFRMTHTSGVNNCHVGGILSYRGVPTYTVSAGGNISPPATYSAHSANGGVFPWTDADTGTMTIGNSSRNAGVQGRELLIAAMFHLDATQTITTLTEPTGMTNRIDIRHTGPSFKLIVWDEFVDPGVSWASKTARMQFSTSDDYAVIFDALWPTADHGIVDTLTAAFSATPTTGLEPLSVDFTDETEGNPDTWLWDFGDSSTSTSQNPTHVYTDDGSYDVSLHVERD